MVGPYIKAKHLVYVPCITCFTKIADHSVLSDQLYFISDLVNTQVVNPTNYDANNRARVQIIITL